MTYLITFLAWTFVIYWCHRAAHHVPIMKELHADHHKQISQETFNGLHWTNLFLYFDSWKSTADQWATEVIPTLLFCLITGQWWMMGLYYVWAAFIQEAVEHNPKFNFYPFITSGKWHLLHHADNTKNFGVFFPIWDILFGTRKDLK
jgi:sterol desaturase/sphingolipid hydroxylase (fatty acid hydroxylase superfamily)